ncbi:hypothetical protein [Halomonas sp. 328]|uniref:hypothetical protein n=1 Tax=Halomonas sp. 328 TaxID=2776704 RepID=UPI0018A72299|nr:hypothetical protein [Halomonas sp. 328]MBF8221951.1 hypothetical protein [Halomonas sp. 328]
MSFVVFFLVVMGLFFLSFLLEFFRFEHGVPIALVDLMFFPLTMVLCFLGLKAVFEMGRKGGRVAELEISNPLSTFAWISIMAIPFSVWVAWNVREGSISPFGPFSLGRGGVVHGYTIMSFGASLVIMWIFIFLKVALKVVRGKGGSRL